MSRRRLDEELVSRGLSADLDQARRVIDSRIVLVDGAPALKAATLVSEGSPIVVNSPREFVSRGGVKLEGALKDFALDVTAMTCLDAGAGSGGFCDCLLKAGADHVVAVDVGYGQFDYRLRNDSRVTLMERTNIRSLRAEPGRFDLIVADLSFVSLTTLAGTIRELAEPSAACVLLVKPQFESPPEEVGPGGIVREPQTWERAISAVVKALENKGMGTVAVAPSRLKGATGNQEFFVHALPHAASTQHVVAAAMRALA